MRKFVYIFNVLAIILIIVSVLGAAGSILWAIEFAEDLQTTSHRKEYFIQYVFSALQQIIYPIAVAAMCLFLSKIAAAFDGPDVQEEIKILINSLRAAGKKDD